MTCDKRIGTVALVVGIVIVLLMLLVDPLGIGQSPNFGYRQWIGVLVGAVVAIVGLVLRRKR